MSRDDAKRVEDIFEAIEAIIVAESLMNSHDGDDRITSVCIDAITYRVFTIGEATKELSPEAKDAHPKRAVVEHRENAGLHRAPLLPPRSRDHLRDDPRTADATSRSV